MSESYCHICSKSYRITGLKSKKIEWCTCKGRIAELEEDKITLRDMTWAQEKELKALRERVAKIPVCVGYVDFDCLDYLRRNCGEEDITVRKARCDIYFYPVYIDPPPMEQDK
jgi:hypothetical protein